MAMLWVDTRVPFSDKFCIVNRCREVEEDVARLKTVAVRLLSDTGISGISLPEDLVYELCRFGASELHCVSAVIGGIAAQEAIKVHT